MRIAGDPSRGGVRFAAASIAMSFSSEDGLDRPSDAPIAMDLLTSTSQLSGLAGPTRRLKIPHAWVGMSGYLVAGIFLGLVLILALSIGREDAASASGPSANSVTDNVVHLHARD